MEHCLKVLDLCERWCLSSVSGHVFVYVVYVCVCFGSLAHRLWVILDHNRVSHDFFSAVYVPVVPSRQLAALAWDGSLPPALGQCFSFMHRPLAPQRTPPGVLALHTLRLRYLPSPVATAALPRRLGPLACTRQSIR